MTLSDISSLTLLGAGKMGSALLSGWIQNGVSGQSVQVIEPAPAPTLEQFAASHGVRLRAAIPETIDSEFLVLAIKPQMMAQLLPSVRLADRLSTTVVSIAAGTSISEIETLLGRGPTIRVMPNTPAQVGRGMSVGVANADADPTTCKKVTALFDAVGRMNWTQLETDIDLVTAVSGSGPAYVFHLVEAMAAAGEAAGLSSEFAMILARQTVIGAGELMHQDSEPAGVLRQNVTSPGGTTAAALSVLMNEGDRCNMTALLRKAVQAAADRSRELASS